MIDVDEYLSRYRRGQLSEDEIIDLFRELVDSGRIHDMLPRYRRVANFWIQAGEIVPKKAWSSPGPYDEFPREVLNDLS